MPAWKYHLNFKQHLTEEETPEAIRRDTAKIVAELNAFVATIDLMQTIGIPAEDAPGNPMLEELQDIIESAEFIDGDLEECNYWLDSIYDWADGWRVWIGGEKELARQRKTEQD